jgi:hypothetical protein
MLYRIIHQEAALDGKVERVLVAVGKHAHRIGARAQVGYSNNIRACWSRKRSFHRGAEAVAVRQ